MKIELQSTLFNSYPLFLRKPTEPTDSDEFTDESPPGPLDYWGIECDDGWFDIVDRLLGKFETHIKQLNIQGVQKDKWPRALQIKEKFGTLRIYFRPYESIPDDLMDAVEQTERASSEVCESCGAPGMLRKDGYLRVVCDHCLKRKEQKAALDVDSYLERLRVLLESRSG